MAELDAKSFFDGLSAENKPKEKKDSQDHANRLSLTSSSMKGTIKLLPVVPDGFQGKPFIKLMGVKETFIKTTQNGKGCGWGYILPIDAYGKMTDDEVDLYNKVNSLWDEVEKLVHSKDQTDFSMIRSKNYTLISGIILDHMDVNGNTINAHIGKPSLLCYPSPMMYKSIAESVTSKVQSLKGNVDIINRIFNNDSVGRKAALSLSFKWVDPNNTRKGYSCSSTIDFNSEFDIAVDPEKDFGKENIDKLMNPIEIFLMWSYDHENDKPFSVKTFNEIRNALLDKKKKLEEENAKLAARLGDAPKDEKLGELQVSTNNEITDAPF